MSADPASTTAGSEQLPPRVATALAVAQIPPSKRGAASRARLSGSERELYVWILRRLATSGRPSTAETREAAARLGLDAGRAHVISMREAILAGQAVFGPVLEEG